MARRLPREDLAELSVIVGRFQSRLGRERLLVFAVRGWIAAGMLVGGLALVAWLTETPLGTRTTTWVVLAPILAALAAAAVRWPSSGEAARTADHHLRLDERLATAVELSGRIRRGRPGRFDLLQVRDAVARAHGPPSAWPPFVARHTRDLALAGLASALALAMLLLQVLPRPHFDPPEAPTAALDALGVETRAVPTDAGDVPPEAVLPAQTSVDEPNDQQLVDRVQQAQTTRQALDRLAGALGQVSAGQAAAEAIQRGDYQAARDQLANLAEESDQLSTAAKQQLAQALQAAANQTQATDRQLADRERQAAQALARGYYNDQRQALRQLGDQVQRSAQSGLSQGQLARDIGRLQQRQSASQQTRVATDEGGSSTSPGTDQASRGNQGAGATGRGAAAGEAQQAGADAQGMAGAGSQGSGEGQQAGAGAGTGVTDPLGDAAGRLDTNGQQVDVPLKLGPGPGERPATGAEDQVSPANGLSGAVAAEQEQHQDPGQVVPETNLVPGDQRPVIRGYFSGEAPTK
jgi:hypothetical protein